MASPAENPNKEKPMTTDRITNTSEIPRLEWQAFCASFTEANVDRLVAVNLVSPQWGDQVWVEGSPFMALDYDDSNETDVKMIISVGIDGMTSHTVEKPQQVWRAQDDEGDDVSLEIVNEAGNHWILMFEESA
jgi:hypothetical protein